MQKFQRIAQAIANFLAISSLLTLNTEFALFFILPNKDSILYLFFPYFNQ